MYGIASAKWSALLLVLTVTKLGTSCPLPCTCNWVEGKYTLNCAMKNISNPPISDGNIESVTLDKNPLNMKGYEFLTAGLRNVRKISMKFCNISQFFGEVFSGLNNLHELDLSRNALTYLKDGQFPSLPQLRILDLSHNILSSIHKNSFSGLGRKVERLDLSNNALMTIPWTTFIPLPSMKQVSLGANPWHCDCKLGELHSHLSRRKIVIESVMCNTPLTVASKNWRNLNQEDFTCSPTVSLPHPAEHSVLPGQVVPLHCQVSGNPTPSVTWTLDGVALLKTNNEVYSIIEKKSGDGSSISIFSVFTIMNMSSTNLGKYSCLAKNSIGMESKDIDLLFLDTAKLKGESENDSLIITITICASIVVIAIGIVIVIYCYAKRLMKIKSSSHSSSFTILEYKKKPSIDSCTTTPWLSPRPSVHDKMSHEDVSGTLSRCSTRQAYLPEVGHHSSGDDGDTITLPRSDSVTLPKVDLDLIATEALSLSSLFTPMTNKPFSRDSIGTISTLPDPIYNCVRRTTTFPPQYHSYAHSTPVPTLWHQRPGYVTLPRRPRYSKCQDQLLDTLGPRTSADGCSHSNISSMSYQNQFTMVPPCSSTSATAINIVGIPAIEVTKQEGDLQNIQEDFGKVCLDTIPEQDCV